MRKKDLYNEAAKVEVISADPSSQLSSAFQDVTTGGHEYDDDSLDQDDSQHIRDSIIFSPFPYSSQIFPHALYRLIVGHANKQNLKIPGLATASLDIEVACNNMRTWSPFKISFKAEENQNGIVNGQLAYLMHDFFDTLECCSPRDVKVVQAESSHLEYEVSCTHPEQLYEMIEEFVAFTKVDTLDMPLAQLKPRNPGKDPFKNAKSAWERISYVQAQLERKREELWQNIEEIKQEEQFQVMHDIQQDAVDFIPPRVMANEEEAFLAGFVTKVSHEYGEVHLERLRYAIAFDCVRTLPSNFALLNYH